MEYLAPSKCRNLDVTDSLKISNTDIGPALSSLQALNGSALVGGGIVNPVNITASGNLIVNGVCSSPCISVRGNPLH